MEQYALLIVNTSFVIVCLAMAIVFLVLPIPRYKGLIKYRLSLRYLAGPYLIMAMLKLIVMAFNISMINFISIERLTISSLQASLFTIALITLLKPQFDIRSYVGKQMGPVIMLDMLYLLISERYGDPKILNFRELIQSAFHPAIIIREVFLLYYIFQIVYLTRLFNRKAQLFKIEIDNYFFDNLQLRLPGVRYCFYLVLSIGLGALLSCFFESERWLMVFTAVCAIFYLGFGIYYIQYPRTFIFIEPALNTVDNYHEELTRVSKRNNWEQLKKKIIDDKYYLREGVNIEEMAHYLKIGRTSLSTFINSEEKMNFNLWINTLRIEEAKRLFIACPGYSLTQVAELIGYSEVSNFSRQFKLITTEPPSVWRFNHKA